jgi:hypothetical protein
MMGGPSKDGGAMMSKEPEQAPGAMMAPSTDSGTMMAPAARAVPFTDLKSAEALAAKGPTVLLFAADRDPAGRMELDQIDAAGPRLGDVTVVVVDPDKAADLKARYRVMGRTAYVQIDAMGKAVAAWSGGGVDGILAHVKI